MITRVEISKRLVMINSASSLVALGLNVTVLVWLQRFLLQRISMEEYSMLPVLYSIMMFAPLVTTTLTQGLGRYTTEAFAKGNSHRVTQIVSSMFPILLAVGSLLLVIGLVLTFYLDVLLSIAPQYLGQAKLMLALLMFSFAMQVILAPFCVGLEIRQKFVVLNFLATGGQLLRLSILFVLLFAVSVKVLWVVVATVSAGFIMQLVILASSLRAVPSLRFRRAAVDWSVARQLLSFGGWSTVSALAMTIRSSADAIILNRLGTPFDVTVFYLGALPLRFITMAGSAAQTPLMPALVAMHATGQAERLRGVFLKGGRWAMWFTLFVAVPLMVYGREIITLYVGAEYRVAGVVMLLLLLLFPIGQGIRMLFPLADATANIRKLSLCLLAMSIVNLGLTLYLVAGINMGAVGSAVGTAVSIVLFYPLVLLPLGLRMAHVDFVTWLGKTLWPGLLPAAVATAVLLGLKFVFQLDTWFSLVSCVAVGSLAYLAVLWFWGLQKDDRQEAIKLLHALRTKLASLCVQTAA